MADATPAPPRTAPSPLNLSEFERNELRGALAFHFEDCPHPDRDDQTLVIECVVERILNRRNVAAAQREVLR